MGQPLTSKAFNEAVAKGGWGPKGCNKQHAVNLPGVIDDGTEGDFFCVGCGRDLGIRQCDGCCGNRYADILGENCCEVNASVGHGCCIHDQGREGVVDIRASTNGAERGP